MLIDRLRTSAVLIAALLGLLYLDASQAVRPGAEGVWLLPLLLLAALGTAWDLGGLLAGSGWAINKPVTLIATGMITLSASVPMAWPLFGAVYPSDCPVGDLGWIVIAAMLATFLIFVGEMIGYRSDSDPVIARTLAGVFVSHYVGLPTALLMAMRMLGDGNWGLAALLTTIAVTKSADAGAYFVGRATGRHKLVPILSPGKTWEGAVGGVVTATAVAYLCLTWLFPWVAGDAGLVATGEFATANLAGGGAVAAGLPSGWWSLLLGPALAIAGIVGDLAESLVKRAAGAKDSGRWLPGLGGVWDVTDSLIAAVVPAFLCFAAAVQ